jgi:predicted dehydrogenase
MSRLISRRSFLQQAGLITATSFFVRHGFSAASRVSANSKLNIGVIGVANQGQYNLNNVATENIVALCDVDEAFLAQASRNFPKAKTYTDFRRLLEQTDIDAVVVATPDHTHAVAAIGALKSGRHVYCEKPLTRTVSESRLVREAARASGLATQLGTQIHAETNYRRVVELVQSGAIGPVGAVHVWVNASYGGMERPRQLFPVPTGLHYEEWLGPVAYRAYSQEYLPGRWRNWWAFGGGALADFGCHYMDLPYWALRLRDPSSVEVLDSTPLHPESTPPWLIVSYVYPASEKHPALRLTWYHGGKQPGRDVLAPELASEWKSGILFIGSKGMLLSDYGRHLLLPEKQFKDFVAPPPTIPNSIGHHAEWIRACKTGEPTTCKFDYSGALTEAVLLGIVAYRTSAKLEWDAEKLAARNIKTAELFIRHQYRPGWEI